MRPMTFSRTLDGGGGCWLDPLRLGFLSHSNFGIFFGGVWIAPLGWETAFFGGLFSRFQPSSGTLLKTKPTCFWAVFRVGITHRRRHITDSVSIDVVCDKVGQLRDFLCGQPSHRLFLTARWSLVSRCRTRMIQRRTRQMRWPARRACFLASVRVGQRHVELACERPGKLAEI